MLYLRSAIKYTTLVAFGILILTSTVNGFNGRCPVEWTYFEDNCYRLERTPLSYANAQTICERAGASLASIASAMENLFVTDLGQLGERAFYIGLNDIADERTFQWTDGTPFRYNRTVKRRCSLLRPKPVPTRPIPGMPITIPRMPWIPGQGMPIQPPTRTFRRVDYCRESELDFSNWNVNKNNPEPNDYGDEEDCIHIIYSTTPGLTGLWNDIPCRLPKYSMCKKEASEEGTLEETSIKCPHSFETFIELGTSAKSVSWSETSYLVNSVAHVERSHSPGVELRKGVTWVNYTFRDSYNISAYCNFSITVIEVDTTPPTIKGCPPDVILVKQPDVAMKVDWIPPSASDLSGNVTILSQSHTPGAAFDTGLNSVNYTFADKSGNQAVCRFTISVFEVTYSKDVKSAYSQGLNEDNGLHNLITGLYVVIIVIGLCVSVLLLFVIRNRNTSKTKPLFKSSYSKMDEENPTNCE